MPIGSIAEVGRELRNMIRVVDEEIIGRTKNWDLILKKYLIKAKFTVGKTPREEAEVLMELIAATGLHIIQPDRWKFRMFSKKIIPAIQSARKVLGVGKDYRLKGVEGRM